MSDTWNDRMPWVPGNRWDLLAHREPEPPRVSVIVTHYAQPTELQRTLIALARQDHPADRLEVIVADDGSPETPVVPAGVRLVRQEDRGFRAAAARNLGAAAASGDVLCFLDADTTPEPDYVRRLTRLPALLLEAVTVGRRRHADLAGASVDAPIAALGPVRELTEPAWLRDAYAASRNLLDADDRSYRHVISAVLACSRAFFEEVGGFDETFSTYGGEDWEWAHRAWQAGGVLAHVPEAVAWHDGPDWAGRPEEHAAQGNRQTLSLAEKIPIDGSRPRGLLSRAIDVEVHLPAGIPADAAFLSVDSLLAALPHLRVVTDAADQPLLAADPRVAPAGGVDPRVTVELEQPIVVLDAAPFARALALLSSAEVGGVVFVTGEGETVGRAANRRARRRAKRWGTDDALDTVRVRVEGAHIVGARPHLEAWVGGWGGPDRYL